MSKAHEQCQEKQKNALQACLSSIWTMRLSLGGSRYVDRLKSAATKNEAVASTTPPMPHQRMIGDGLLDEIKATTTDDAIGTTNSKQAKQAAKKIRFLLIAQKCAAAMVFLIGFTMVVCSSELIGFGMLVIAIGFYVC